MCGVKRGMNNNSNVNQGINHQFLDYMSNLIKKGYSYQQIVSYLQKYNYPVSTVNYYYSLAQKNIVTTQPQINQNNIQPQQNQQSSQSQLSQYIQNMQTRGYSFQQIKSYLMKYGYSEQSINSAINLSNQSFQNSSQQSSQIIHKHEIHIPSKTVFTIIFIFLIISVIGSGSYFVVSSLTSSTLLDVIVQPESTNLNNNDLLRFDVSILNMGSSKKTFDVFLDYKIIDSYGNEVYTGKETRALSTSISINKKISLTDFYPGNYHVSVIGSYDDKVATSSFDFRINSNGANINYSNNGTALPPQNNYTNPNPNVNPHPDIDDAENVEVIKFGDFINRLIRTSNNDPVKAIANCKTIKDSINVDKCLENVAIKFNESDVCAEILDPDIRDDCYIGSMIKGDINVCQYITNQKSKSDCNLVKNLYLIQQYEQSGNSNIDDIALELNMNITTVDYIEDDEEIYVINIY